VSHDGFRAPIAELPSAYQHRTIWLRLIGLYSGQ